MADGETRYDDASAAVRQLRWLAAVDGIDTHPDTVPGWRDDLRLFALTWAIGFIFFLILIA